ncbi:MAG: hypothetical protein H7A35_07835 [Planctomycetales bacterium]|nr:hypothetical protein [bacterium]UNM09963.1 MAG: hypothetical protein H7A35_07835 [Planctomycetales bacterium]
MGMTKRILSIAALASATIIGLMAAAQASMFDLVSDADYSQWGMRNRPFPFLPGEGKFADYGCFPLGNGYIFGHLGVDGDFSLMRGLTGPGYQTRGDNGDWQVWQEGNWPDIALSFKATAPKGSFNPVFHLGEQWGAQSIQQVLGAAIVRVRQSADFGELDCIQYAVSGMPVLVREYRFRPVEGRADPDWQYCLQVGTEANETEYDGLVFHQGENRLTIQCSGFLEVDGLQQCIAGEMQEDGSWRCTVAYIASKAGEPRTAVELDSAGLADLATRTREWWREFSAANYGYEDALAWPWSDMPHFGSEWMQPRLSHMMLQLPVIIETQRDHYSGSSSPMVSYHGCWVRDNNGIILTDIVNKRYDNVMRLLRYHRAACVSYGSCPMLVPLDLDLSGLDGWQPGEPGTAGDLSGIGATGFDWSAFGVEHAEVPSLIVLQHYLLWRAMMQDGMVEEATEFMQESWGFVTHNLMAMDYSTEYGVRFHGDETYTQGALYSTYDRVESGQIGWPNGYIPTNFYSFDNTILHRAAAAAIIEMSGSIGLDSGFDVALRIRDELDDVVNDNYILDGRIVAAISPSTGQPWLPPFSNINLRPYWLGLDYGLDEELLRDNFIRVRRYLNYIRPVDRADGKHLPDSTPWSGYMTGHNIAYFISGNCSVAENVFLGTENLGYEVVIGTASPEGAWCEVLGPDGAPVDIYGRTNRIRPWESGVNYQAIVRMMEDGIDYIAEEKVREWDRSTEPPVATASHDTQILALTRDNHFRELYPLDSRMAWVEQQHITAWDIALPFSPDELARALMFEEGDIDYNIPFLFIDRDVRTGLDRRTMKDEHFWAEMDKVIAEYEAAGGIVVTEDTLQLSLADDEAVGLKVLVALYPNTFAHRMTDGEIANFRDEVGSWMDWYREMAGDRLQFELDYLVMPHTLSPEQCGRENGNVFWLGSTDVEADLRAYGVPDNHYDLVACFWGWDRDRQQIELDGEQALQAYGGAAQGPAPDMAFMGQAGRTGYYGSAILNSHPDNIHKVAIHELLHNIDGLFRTAGMPGDFLNADDMAANIELLLREQPGCFEAVGFTDEAIRGLADREMRKEAGFPWEAQLVYYEWMLRRTPRDSYARLLLNYGERVKQSAEPVDLKALGEDFGNRYVAAVLADDDIDCLIGQDFEIYLDMEQSGVLPPGVGIELVAEFAGERMATLPEGEGWMLRIPQDSIGNGALALHFDVLDYTLPRNRLDTQLCFPVRTVQLHLRPIWHAELDWDDAENKMTVAISGPEGTYDWKLSTAHHPSLIEERLHEDGLLADFQYEAEGSIANGGEAVLGMHAEQYARLRNESFSLDVTFTDESGNSGSFSHSFPGTQRLRDRLKGIDPKALPDYVIRATYYDESLDEEYATGKMPFNPQENSISPKNGNVFSGQVESEVDAKLDFTVYYDEDTVHLFVILTDDMAPGNGIWDSDRINLCFDTLVDSDEMDYPNGPVGHTAWQADDYWVFFCPFVTDGPRVMRLGGLNPSGVGNGYYGPVADCDYYVGIINDLRSSEAGRANSADSRTQFVHEYGVTWTIPLSELPYLDATPGSFCGFTIFYSDYDEGLSEMMYFNDWGGDNGIDWRFWDTGLLYFEPPGEPQD